ncbi:MAG: rhodanese-like domain-containing protein [Planctomycetaceae bacterium]|nr:rhodanese-like domain-containing protein [Planctomycetaceae bacterium]
MSVSTITPQRLHDVVQSGAEVELIDVRTPVEFREVHVSFARNVPLDQLGSATSAAGRSGAAQPLYVICRSGGRGKQACEKLLAAGYTNVVNVEGGTQAWDQAALPVVRGPMAMSLERQVRIAAGALVLVGALLTYFAHPYWTALSAFVGAGLVFAGITDYCGMGMLLAKMPWNQIRGSDAKSELSAKCGLAGCN